MTKKKNKLEIVFTTIKVAGYCDGKQRTNAITCCLMSFGDNDTKSLIDKERQELEAAAQKRLPEGLVAKTKIVKTERKYIDGIIGPETKPKQQKEDEE